VTRIVVGVDGSPCGEQALRWAYQHAQTTGAEIDAVLAWNEHPLLAGIAETLGGGVPLDKVEQQANDMLEAAVDGVIGADVTVTKTLAAGPAGEALVTAASTAALLVVGRHSGNGGHRLGSVGAHCARHATCPVVIVPDQ
jgi:nucleotide-binding universal stress UspA family protein